MRGGRNGELVSGLALKRIVEIASVADNGGVTNCEVRTARLRSLAVVATEVGGVKDSGDEFNLFVGDMHDNRSKRRINKK